jgi:hypothetical protein
MIEHIIIFIIGGMVGVVVAIFALSLCRISDEADRRMGYKE